MHIYNFPEELTKPRDMFLGDWQGKRNIGDARKAELRCAINKFYLFLKTKSITNLRAVTDALSIRFQYYLYNEHYSTWFVYRKTKDLDLYFGWLYYKEIIYKNPFTGIKLINPPDETVNKIKRYYNWGELAKLWETYLKKQGIHYLTIEPKLRSLQLFINFLKDRKIKTVYKVKPETIDEYQEYLTTYKYNRYGEDNPQCAAGYGPFEQVNKLRHVCQFLLFLWWRKLIKGNPSENINLRKRLKELNKKVWHTIGRKASPLTGMKTEWDKLINKFVEYKLSMGGSKYSSKKYELAVKLFYKYCAERYPAVKIDLKKITKRDLIDYQAWICRIKNSRGQKYSGNSICKHISLLVTFFRFLLKIDYLICDPSSAVDLPKSENGIPHNCMEQKEVIKLLNQPDTNTGIGIRDRAIMEIFYSTGVRMNELVNLKINDINFTEGLITIDVPKGGKSYQRVVPIGKIACYYAQKYINEVRKHLDPSNTKEAMFLSSAGRPVIDSLIRCAMKKYLARTGIRKKITAHSFRVSCATHMLQHDADIRYVQQQLGHASIRSTQKYTRLVPKDLKIVHARTHPREKIIASY